MRGAQVQARELSAVLEFVALCRAAGVAIVYADSADYPAIADVSGDFVYARLENAVEEEPTGYTAAELDPQLGRAATDMVEPGFGAPEAGCPMSIRTRPRSSSFSRERPSSSLHQRRQGPRAGRRDGS